MSFVKQIEKISSINKLSYIDSIIYWCDKNNIEIDLIAEYIKKDNVLKSKIQVEAELLNILKKGARLPI